MQLPLPAAATKTACSWNDDTFAHACDTGAAKKYAFAVRNSIAPQPALPDAAELLAVVPPAFPPASVPPFPPASPGDVGPQPRAERHLVHELGESL